MKTKLHPTQRDGFSRVELLAIIVVVAIVAAAILPMLAKPRHRASRVNCVNNLKQIGLSFRMWAQDNGEKLPAQVSTNEGGAIEFVSTGNTFRQFLVMSNELSTPRILLCPDDTERKFATNFNSLSELNVSFFIVPEADVGNADMWLVGDRNLTVGGKPLLPGLHWLPTNSPMGWTAQMHENKGNLCFANASVQQLSGARLRESATNALRALQEANASNASFRLLIP